MGILGNISKIWSQDMAIDLGTANTLVVLKGQGVVLKEPSVVAVVEENGNEGAHSDATCATTLPQLQVFLDLDVSLANADVAAVASPFGDLTGDGNVDAVIMVKMVNFFDVNGYQFNFSLDPDIVDVLGEL